MGVGMGQAAHMGPASLERVRVPVRLFSGRRRSRAARCNVARGRFRRTGLSAALSLLLLSTFGGPATPAFAAAPFPSPSTADQLACDLSPASNAGDFSSWWAAIPANATFAGWLWNDIVPNNGGTACRADVAQTFWTRAVPGNWALIGNIGGWPFASGGYYTQWFWLHGGPDSWAARPEMAIGGKGGAGYYDYSFYHFATVRDFAWRNALSINGSAGAGYFDYWYHRDFGQNVAHYQRLLGLAGGYLNNASTFTPVSSWFG